MVDEFEAAVNACVNELSELKWPTGDKHAQAQACIEYAAFLCVNDSATATEYLPEALAQAIDHYLGAA